MTATFFKITLCIVLTLGIPADAQALVLSTPVPDNFDPRHTTCNLTTPILNWQDKVTVDVPDDWTLEEDQKLMVGYVKILQVFGNKGCVEHLKDKTKTAITFINRSTLDPGSCYSACKTNTFGIQLSRCVCIERWLPKDDIYTTSDQCLAECDGLNGVTCGNQHSNIYTSIYQHEENDLGDDGKNCLACNPTTGKCFWQVCGIHMRGLCVNEERYSVTNIKNPWKEYLNNCPPNQNKPRFHPARTLNDSHDIEDNNEDFWIANIKSYVITDIKDVSEKKWNNAFRYGYIMKTNGIVHLDFTDSSEGLNRLCLEVSINKDSNTYTKTTEEHKDIAADRDSGHGMVAAYVLIPLILIVIVCAIVSVICTRKRRRRNSSGCKDDFEASKKTTNRNEVTENQKDEFGISRNPNQMDGSPETEYAECSIEEFGISRNPNQMDGSPETEYAECSIEEFGISRIPNQMGFSPETEYAECSIELNADKNVYDTSSGMSRSDNNISCNIYSGFKDSEDDTYDHAVTTNNKPIHKPLKRTDNIYN